VSAGAPPPAPDPTGPRPRPDTRLVVPCYDEATRLRDATFLDALSERPWLSLLFVDDGSRDATAERLEALVARAGARATLLRLGENRGKGEAVRAGLCAALAREDAVFVGYWDADGATPFAELDRLAGHLASHAGLLGAIGSRRPAPDAEIRRSAWRAVAARVASALIVRALGARLHDTMCGAKLFRAGPRLERVLAEPFRTRWTFDVELLARISADAGPGSDLGEIVHEVPIRRWRDVPGSKVRPADVARVPFDLWRIRHAHPPRARRPEG
jgi:glycosyltransferase involved in cell wall biosynthesis